MPTRVPLTAGIYPQSFPLPQSTSFTDTYWLIQNYALRDTNAHDNTTTTGSVPDGGTPLNPGPFFILPLTDEIPRIDAYAVWFYNGTDQAITAQILGNVVSDLSYPNFTFGSPSPSIAASSPWWFYQYFPQGPLEFIAGQILAGVQPTTGAVQAILFVYHKS